MVNVVFLYKVETLVSESLGKVFNEHSSSKPDQSIALLTAIRSVIICIFLLFYVNFHQYSRVSQLKLLPGFRAYFHAVKAISRH